MHDYYLDFESNQCETNQKCLISQGANGPYVPIAPSGDSEYPEKIVCERANNLPISYVPRNEIGPCGPPDSKTLVKSQSECLPLKVGRSALSD